MDRLLFAGEDCLHRTNVPAENHVEVAIVDGTADHGVGLVVIWDKGKVEGLAAGGVQIVRALLGRRDRLPQTINLPRFFIKLLLRNADRNVELRNLRLQFACFSRTFSVFVPVVVLSRTLSVSSTS